MQETCTIKSKSKKNYEAKHISKLPPSEENAKTKSCERNKMFNGAFKSGENGVVFESDKRSNGFIKPYFGQSDRCAVEYDDLWVCRGVQVNPTPTTVQECKKNWGKNQGCRSCKTKIKNAKGFYFEVLNKDGHLDYRNMYWIDTWGGYHKMDAQKNC